MRAFLVLSALALLAAPAAALAVPCCCNSHMTGTHAAPADDGGCCGEKAPAEKPECGCMHGSQQAVPPEPAAISTIDTAFITTFEPACPAPVVEILENHSKHSGTHSSDPPLYLANRTFRL